MPLAATTPLAPRGNIYHLKESPKSPPQVWACFRRVSYCQLRSRSGDSHSSSCAGAAAPSGHNKEGAGGERTAEGRMSRGRAMRINPKRAMGLRAARAAAAAAAALALSLWAPRGAAAARATRARASPLVGVSDEVRVWGGVPNGPLSRARQSPCIPRGDPLEVLAGQLRRFGSLAHIQGFHSWSNIINCQSHL